MYYNGIGLLPFLFALIFSGLLSGFIAGLLGVGGGIIIVPVLYHVLSSLGFSTEIIMHVSVATSLAIIVPTGWRSYVTHKRNNAVDFTILKKWFDERVVYKNAMKKAFKANDKEKGEYYYLMQYTMKILLNSLYGATALPSFRYGMNLSILSEAITLTGHRIIQESALCANRHMNKVINNKIKLEI